MTGRLRLPLALAAAVVVAEAAVLLLRPRSGVIDPAQVDAEGYFSPEQIERAVDFRGPQMALFIARAAVELGVLAYLARRPPRWLRRAKHPALAGAAAGATLALATNVAAVPIAAVMRQRAMDVGLVTQSWLGWVGDLAKSWTIGAVFAAAGGALALALLRRYPRRWWLPGAAIVVAFAVVTTYASPVVLDPLFNRFEPLRAGQTRADVLRLAERAGVDVGEVLVMDASRRTTAANAYVTGLGHTKRVVLYDTLLEGFEPEEVRQVVAHELAHVHYRDVTHGLLYLLIVAPAGMFAAAALTERFRGGRTGAEAIPALALALGIVVPIVTVISGQLSRRVEARADSYALQLTREPEPFIDFERRIAIRNVSDPDPPKWQVWLFSTHPPVIERIGAAVSFRESLDRRRTREGS